MFPEQQLKTINVLEITLSRYGLSWFSKVNFKEVFPNLQSISIIIASNVPNEDRILDQAKWHLEKDQQLTCKIAYSKMPSDEWIYYIGRHRTQYEREEELGVEEVVRQRLLYKYSCEEDCDHGDGSAEDDSSD